MVGATGFEPVTSSVSANPGTAVLDAVLPGHRQPSTLKLSALLPFSYHLGKQMVLFMRQRHTESSDDRRSGPGPLAGAADDADTHAAQRGAHPPTEDAAGPRRWP